MIVGKKIKKVDQVLMMLLTNWLKIKIKSLMKKKSQEKKALLKKLFQIMMKINLKLM
jgi:hypothetical protein